ncbi:MAG: hypothetical protein EOO27_41055 [Comamonadaceae bacterium]|nr:MAG: hypothetical protein EOO27_41055 [Comamonadaceae bacterium]
MTWVAALGSALFRRLPRGLELTEDGSSLHVEVNSLAAVADKIRQQQQTQIIRVQSLPTFTMRWLIPRLPDFQRRYPEIEIRLSIAADAMPRANDFEVFVTGGPESHHGFRSGRFLDENGCEACCPAKAPDHRDGAVHSSTSEKKEVAEASL